MQRLFIPSEKNDHRPHLIRSKALAIYSIFLIIFQIGFHLFVNSQQSEVIAATSITAEDLFSLTNQERTKLSLPILKSNALLASAAYNKGVDMFADQYWAHVAPDGTTPWDFILGAGYDYHYAGENLAKDFTQASSIVAAWMNSPSHRDNIVNENFEDMGIAVVSGTFNGEETTICVQMFGTVMSEPTPPDNPPPSENNNPPPSEDNNPPENNENPGGNNTPPATPSVVQNNIPVQDTTPPEPPVILEPKNNSTLNNDQPTISGTSSEKATIALYDAQNEMGSLPTDDQNAFSFRPEKPLTEGEHLFSATAMDDTGNKSNPSSITTVIIDTFPPVIDKESVTIEPFYRFNQKALRISVIVLADPQEVTASLGDYALILEKDNNTYTGILAPQEENLFNQYPEVTIKSHDQAGNITELKITIPNFPSSGDNFSSNQILGQIQQNANSSLSKLIPRTPQETTRMFYSFFGIGLMGLMTLNTVIIEKKKIAQTGSNTFTHAVILGISLMGVIWGNLGLISSGLSNIR